ncbi:MAG: helicase HerA-like domain-containing protein [Acidimicrobiales bacterium]
MERPPGHLFVGEEIQAESGDRTGESVLLDSADFTTHGVIVGMTGSGKTGLGVVLLEEALLAGIPVLAIDPKGDLGNLCLTFPDLAPGDFEPWMDEGTARVEKKTTAEMASATAELWKGGLASWGLGSADVGNLATSANPVIYTPGSRAGVPLDVLGRLTAPATDDPSARQDEVDSTVSGLLGLVGVESDPLSGREHILLANLITRAWDEGRDLDLPTLLGQLLDPPIRKLGVLELDTFFPAKDRQALVMKLNGLLASPSFAAWAEGAPLDIEKMLWDETGKARAAIMSLGHLEETERQFAVTLVLSKLISWMRTQSGTGELRVLVYLDEVMGLAPPNGNPPTKKPILTLLKQARAFGVGLVLSTQNPVDLDYKAISNAGTWMIGRLQTEQDKNRLIDGLRSADGGVDINEVTETISGLGKRQFMLRTTKSSKMPLLTTRWAMSYLAGPLTREQIGRLMAPKLQAILGAAAGGNVASGGGATSTPTGDSAAQPAAAATPTAPTGPVLADDETAVPPSLPDSVVVRYARSAAPWLTDIDAVPGGDRLTPVLAARIDLLFDETKAKLRHTEEWEAIIPLTGDSIDVDNAITVDFDDRDFVSEAPEGAIYVLPEFDITASAIKSAGAALKNKLTVDETVTLLHNAELKLWSRPEESAEEFAKRCDAAAEDGADAATEKIRAKLDKKRDSVEAALAKAEDRVAELEIKAQGRKQQQLVDIGASVLGSLLGGRSRTRGMASAARRMSSGSRQSASAKASLESAQNRAAEKIGQLEELEQDLQDAVIEIDDEWTEKAQAVEEYEVPLEKSDITVDDLMLVWLPIER